MAVIPLDRWPTNDRCGDDCLVIGAIDWYWVLLAVPLSLARVSENIWLRGPVWLFTYIFRGTPLYIQLLIIYSGIYSFDYVHEHQTLDAFLERA